MVKKGRLVKTFMDLVQIDSPSGEEDAMVQELSKRLKALGAKSVERDSFGNVIAKFDGKGELLMLNAHMDTVEPGRGIKPQVDGDIIKTDESTVLGGDPKAGVSAILEALESVKEDNKKHLPLEIVFTRGEENGLEGARNLNYSLLKAKKGLTFDGDEEVHKVFINGPGYNRVDLEVIGRSAHAGQEPEKGLSAIKIAADILSQLEVGRIDHETTANIGLIEGGSARNAVPEKVILKGEIRSRNSKKLEKHTDHFRNVFQTVLEKYPDAKINVEIERIFNPYALKPENEMIQYVVKALKKVGMDASLMDAGGGTDAHIFHQHGIVSIIIGTGDYNAHTVREYVKIPEMLEAALFAEKVIT